MSAVRKKRIYPFVIAAFCLSACGVTGDKADTSLEESTYTYRELEQMEEVTAEEDKIIFVLYEDQALPYVWCTYANEGNPELLADETVEGDSAFANAGDSPAYHVFVYQWTADGEANIELLYKRYDSDDRRDVAEIRELYASRQGEKVVCEEVSREYPE